MVSSILPSMRKLLALIAVLLAIHVALLFVRPSGAAQPPTDDAARALRRDGALRREQRSRPPLADRRLAHPLTSTCPVWAA